MILRFRHRGLERLHWRGDTSGVSAQHVKRLAPCWPHSKRRWCRPIWRCPVRGCIRCRGDRAGQWSVTISGNWRVVFEFEGRNATNVDLIDYH